MNSPPSRRTTLQAAASGIALTLVPMGFTAESAAAPGGPRSATTTGHLDPGAADWVYLPVRVPGPGPVAALAADPGVWRDDGNCSDRECARQLRRL